MPELSSSISVKYLLVVLVLFSAAGLSKGRDYRRSKGNDCSSEPETGPCRGYFPSFYFDPSDKTCKRFIYGGCRGNGNRYDTKKACLEACGNDCSSKPDAGPCCGYFPKFYFDPSDKTCKRFIYGGCRGNGNRYDTKKACLEACGNDCSSKPDTGPCRGYFPKFYFDPSDKTCKRFIYGGCRGNGNRYDTKKACLKACGRQ